MAWGAIAAGVIGAGASLLGNSASNDAASDGANAQLQASREQIALQREMMERAEKLLAPYVRQGERADGYISALLYGSGTLPSGQKVTRDQAMRLIRNSPLYQQADEDLVARYQEANRLYNEETGLNNAERDRFLQITDDDYARRSAYTEDAINDRATLNADNNQRALDRAAGAFGVNGLAGNFARTVTDETNRNNTEFAGTARGWRGEDLDNQTAGRRDAYGRYYDSSRASTLRRGATRAGAYDAASAGRAEAYGDYTAGLTSRSDRGFRAASGQASAGQNFADAAGHALGYGADAYADAQNTIGQNRADMWGDIGSTVADVIGGISNQQKQKSRKSSYYGT